MCWWFMLSESLNATKMTGSTYFYYIHPWFPLVLVNSPGRCWWFVQCVVFKLAFRLLQAVAAWSLFQFPLPSSFVCHIRHWNNVDLQNWFSTEQGGVRDHTGELEGYELPLRSVHVGRVLSLDLSDCVVDNDFFIGWTIPLGIIVLILVWTSSHILF